MFQEYQQYALTLLENLAPQELELKNPVLAEELLTELNLSQIAKNEILGREFGKGNKLKIFLIYSPYQLSCAFHSF